MDRERHLPEEAIAVETYVEERRGRWEVSIVVVFADEVVRKAITTYHTQRMATIAAAWIKRAAQRDFAGPRLHVDASRSDTTAQIEQPAHTDDPEGRPDEER